jgi:hypothetical protein
MAPKSKRGKAKGEKKKKDEKGSFSSSLHQLIN